MNNWEILGIEPTDDIEVIKNAYARKSRIYHPETNPEEFQQLHRAYKAIVTRLRDPHFIQTEPVIIHKTVIPDSSIIPELMNPGESAPSSNDDNSFNSDMEFLEKIDAATRNHQNEIYEKYGLNELNDLLSGQAGYSEWKKYFTGRQFLDNQYNEEYIKTAASCIDTFFQNQIDIDGKCIPAPPQAFTYITIAYGCFFPAVLTPLETTENVYKVSMLEPYKIAFRHYGSKRITYTAIEKDPVFLGERFAFYVYRNILEILNAPYINKDMLHQWLAWGLAEEHSARMSDIYHYAPTHGVRISTAQTRLTEKIFRSDVIFELLSYLLTQKTTPPVYKEVLKNICETFMMNPGCCDEIKSLVRCVNHRFVLSFT